MVGRSAPHCSGGSLRNSGLRQCGQKCRHAPSPFAVMQEVGGKWSRTDHPSHPNSWSTLERKIRQVILLFYSWSSPPSEQPKAASQMCLFGWASLGLPKTPTRPIQRGHLAGPSIIIEVSVVFIFSVVFWREIVMDLFKLVSPVFLYLSRMMNSLTTTTWNGHKPKVGSQTMI